MTSAQVQAEVGRGRSTVVVPVRCGRAARTAPAARHRRGPRRSPRSSPRRAPRGLCAPTIRMGCSQHHLAFAGTLSLRPQTLQMIVDDLVDSLARHGFRRVVLLATHGANEGPLVEAGAGSRDDGVTVVVPSLRVALGALLEVQAPGACRPAKP